MITVIDPQVSRLEARIKELEANQNWYKVVAGKEGGDLVIDLGDADKWHVDCDGHIRILGVY